MPADPNPFDRSPTYLKAKFNMRSLLTLIPACAALVATSATAHDTWVEPTAAVVETGEYTYVHLMLGNHGNEHRDFKLASKITLAPCTLTQVAPSGQSTDLIPGIIDMGSAEKEGYWTARCQISEPGVHRVVHTLDTLHKTVRAVKSGKTFVLGVDRGGQAVADVEADRELGSGLELVLQTPWNEIAAGSPLELKVLRSGKPLAGARVAFIPRSRTLAADFDPEFERHSDSEGRVRFTPEQGDVVLAVVHHVAADESSADYERTHYSATMVLAVPNQPRAAK